MNKGKLLIEAHIQVINEEFTREDVKRVMFIIPDDKAPDADGFNSKFFKHCWDNVGSEVTDAILVFFRTGNC